MNCGLSRLGGCRPWCRHGYFRACATGTRRDAQNQNHDTRSQRSHRTSRRDAGTIAVAGNPLKCAIPWRDQKRDNGRFVRVSVPSASRGGKAGQRPDWPSVQAMAAGAPDWIVTKLWAPNQTGRSTLARSNASTSVRSSRSGVIDTSPRSTAQRSVPSSTSSTGATVSQKCSRPIGSRPGTTRPS